MHRSVRSGVFVTLASLAAACGAEDANTDLVSALSEEGERVSEDRASLAPDDLSPPLIAKLNASGFARTATSSHDVDATNPFFQSLGTNGRACATCHQFGEGMTLTPAGVKLRFITTAGTDPLFAPHDAAGAPTLDVSTVAARKTAYALLLERAVIRVGLPVKPDSEFELAAVDDPYGYASAAQLSLFRRPLPTTNLRFVATVNWDGRGTLVADPTNVHQSLKNQSNGATVNHARAPAPIADDVREAIVRFETSLVTAQDFSFRASSLRAFGASGGPEPLLDQPFALPPGPSTPAAPPGFDLFAPWRGLPSSWGFDAKRDIAEGERLFAERPLGPGGGTCAGCHASANVGGSTGFALFDVGVSAPARRAPNVPLYTFRHKLTGETVRTTDPGRALVSGRWSDMNRFKVPGLRALAARAPFFHDGSAASLGDVVDHYDARFGAGFTPDERRKIVRFLEAL